MASDPPPDLQYAEVICRECGKEYTCTPEQDYYNATNNLDGVCWDCLLKESNMKAQAEPEAPAMGIDDMIGIRLIGGPPPLDGWANAYAAHELWGWPPPEEIAAFNIGGAVAVALPDNVPGDMKEHVTLYRKVQQSSMTEAPKSGSHVFRGATYEVVSNE